MNKKGVVIVTSVAGAVIDDENSILILHVLFLLHGLGDEPAFVYTDRVLVVIRRGLHGQDGNHPSSRRMRFQMTCQVES